MPSRCEGSEWGPAGVRNPRAAGSQVLFASWASVAREEVWTEDRASGTTLEGGQAGSRSRGAAAPLITCPLWSHLGLHTSCILYTCEPKTLLGGAQLLPRGRAIAELCTPRWASLSARLPAALKLGRWVPGCGCHCLGAQHGVGPTPWSLLLPAKMGWVLAASWGAPPGAHICTDPQGLRQQLAPEKGGEHRSLCSVPVPLPEAVFIPAALWVAGRGPFAGSPEPWPFLAVDGLCWRACACGWSHPCLQRGLVFSAVLGSWRDRCHPGEGGPLRRDLHRW